MEKNNLSGILIGLCLGIIMLFGIGLWKMGYKMEQNERENQSLRSALADKMEQISVLSADKEVLTEDLKAYASSTQTAIAKIEQEREEKEAKVVEVSQTPIDFNGSAQSWISELKSELEELSRQESELLDELSTEQESLDPLSDELAQIEEKYSSILKTETASKELKTTVASLERKLSLLESEKEELLVQMGSIKDRSKDLTSENVRLKKELSDLETNIEKDNKIKVSKKAEKQIKQLKNELNDYKSTVEELELDLKSKDVKLKRINEDKDELTKQLISLQGELVKAREADTDNARVKIMQDKISDLEKDKTKLQYALKELQEKFDKMNLELGSVVSGRDELAEESLKMQKRLESIEIEKSDKADEINRLEKQLRKVKSSGMSDSKLAKTLEEEKEKYEKVNTLYSRLKEQLKEVAMILAKRDELITKREAQLQTVTREKDFLDKKVKYLEDFFEKFKKQQTMTYEKLNGMAEDIEGASREVDVVVTSSLLEE